MLQMKWTQNPLVCLLVQRKVLQKPFFGTPHCCGILTAESTNWFSNMNCCLTKQPWVLASTRTSRRGHAGTNTGCAHLQYRHAVLNHGLGAQSRCFTAVLLYGGPGSQQHSGHCATLRRPYFIPHLKHLTRVTCIATVAFHDWIAIRILSQVIHLFQLALTIGK